MNRTQFIQKVIEAKGAKNYLELGIESGQNFLSLRCKRKNAVDPKFNLPFGRKLKWLLLNPHNWFAKYYQETSETFFYKHKAELTKLKPFDVVFIHGQYSFEASIKNVLNSLQHLGRDGVIIIHNCFPPHRAVAISAKDISKNEKKPIEGLFGDVFKSIIYLRTKYLDTLRVRVLETDNGLGIITLKKKFNYLPEIDQELLSKVDKMTWDEMAEDPEQIIGLVPLENVSQLLGELPKRKS